MLKKLKGSKLSLAQSIAFLDFPFDVADSTGIHTGNVAPRKPGGHVPLKSGKIAAIQAHPFLEMLTDAAPSHIGDVFCDEPDEEIRSRARALLKIAFVKKRGENELPSYTLHADGAVAVMVSRRGDPA